MIDAVIADDVVTADAVTVDGGDDVGVDGVDVMFGDAAVDLPVKLNRFWLAISRWLPGLTSFS